MVTSGFNFEGHKIVKYHGIVMAQHLVSLSLNANKQEDIWISAKNNLLSKLMDQAAALSADSIIGVSFSVTTQSGNVIYLIASGTAVSTDPV